MSHFCDWQEHAVIILIIMYFTLYPMLFLEDQLKTQELCPTSQSTIAVEGNTKNVIFVVRASGRRSKNWKNAIWRDDGFSPWQIVVTEGRSAGKMLALWQNMMQRVRETISFSFSVNFWFTMFLSLFLSQLISDLRLGGKLGVFRIWADYYYFPPLV